MSPVLNVAGKIAVVTGGASGIGKAIARALLSRGATVVLADIEQPALDQAAGDLGVIGIPVDVSSRSSMQQLADEVVSRFGGVDIVCSNAGVGSTARLSDMSQQDWQWLLSINLWGLIHVIAVFLPLLRSRPSGGHLAVTASEAGFHISPNIGGYSVTKFAVVAMAEGLAQELAEENASVGVTILCPGPVSTRLGSSQRNRQVAHDQGCLIDNDLEQSEAGKDLRWISPDDVAITLLEAMREGRLFAFTHPEMAPLIEARYDRIREALNG